jgi:hypothetical protein
VFSQGVQFSKEVFTFFIRENQALDERRAGCVHARWYMLGDDGVDFDRMVWNSPDLNPI